MFKGNAYATHHQRVTHRFGFFFKKKAKDRITAVFSWTADAQQSFGWCSTHHQRVSHFGFFLQKKRIGTFKWRTVETVASGETYRAADGG